jgi:hypothetical protein
MSPISRLEHKTGRAKMNLEIDFPGKILIALTWATPIYAIATSRWAEKLVNEPERDSRVVNRLDQSSVSDHSPQATSHNQSRVHVLDT